MFQRTTPMRTCRQPKYRRLRPAASLCVAMWHQSSIWTARLLPDPSHTLQSWYAYFFIVWRSSLIHDCQLHFNLQTAGSWTAIYGGFDYKGLYNYIIDVFEDAPGPAAKKRAQDLLNWWSMWVFPLRTRSIWLNSHHDRKIFPAASLHRRSNTLASRKAFKQQRAAWVEEEAAWAVHCYI